MARILSLCALALLALGCAPRASLTPPTSFVTLDPADDGYSQRSLTADGVVLAVREVPNRPRGPLTFWTEAIGNRLRHRGGYALVGEDDVRAATGEPGHRLRLARDEGRRGYVYWLTIYDAGDRLVIVEAGGREDRFAPLEDDIRASIDRLRLR